MATWTGHYRLPHDAFPLGEHVEVAVASNRYMATLVNRPVPYTIVAWDTSTTPTPEQEADLEQVRRAMCTLANVEMSASIPKLAVVSAGDGAARLFFRGRLAQGKPWHPRVASTGLLGLGVALTRDGTTAALVGGPLGSKMVVGTPAGLRVIGREDHDGDTFITLSVTILPQISAVGAP